MKTWIERIEAAKKRGRFLPTDAIAASDFKTCAVSEHIDLYHPTKSGRPLHLKMWVRDLPVFRLGLDFCSAVQGGSMSLRLHHATREIAHAERLYHKIQDAALDAKRQAP